MHMKPSECNPIATATQQRSGASSMSSDDPSSSHAFFRHGAKFRNTANANASTS